jgi:hypothetical protein
LKDLEDNGKHKEAFDIKIKEANEKQTTLELENKALKEQLKTQARDADVKSLLSGLKFRNPKALDMAFKEISNQLVLNDKGDWVHRSGVLLNDFVVTFAKDEANSFLFEPEVSTGAGTVKPGASNGSPTGKSLFSLPQTEVMKMAAEGRLPNRK